MQDLVTDSFYKAKDLEDFETLKVDSTLNSTLYLMYRFNFKDSISTNNLSIETILIFEKSEEDAKNILKLRESTERWGIKAHTQKDQQIQYSKIDSIFSFRETSKALQFRKDGYLNRYMLTGRTKKIVLLHSIRGYHIDHFKHVDVLKEKINNLTVFASKYE